MTPTDQLTASLVADVPRLEKHEPQVFRRLLDRCLVVGRKSYSPWNAHAETRDMVDETLQELLDACIYLTMELVRRDEARKLAAHIALMEANKREPVEPVVCSSFELIGDVFHEVLR